MWKRIFDLAIALDLLAASRQAAGLAAAKQWRLLALKCRGSKMPKAHFVKVLLRVMDQLGASPYGRSGQRL